MSDTVLVLTGSSVIGTQWAARGLKQSLKPIGGAGQLERTVNGELIDLSETQMRKFASTISGEDVYSPALNAVWPGDELTVDCIVELAYLTATGSADRTVVSGSSRVEGDYTYYRPQLTMRVMDFNVEEDEWGKVVSWQMDLEEV